jgi:hypothetical protein
MFYPKNVPSIERVIRIVIGVALVALVLSGRSFLGNLSPVMTVIAFASAVFIAVTGFVGWCPACALVGRKIKQQQTEK